MRDHLVFYVNGIRRRVGARDAVKTLADYLRDGENLPRLTGTKVACAEGDCGACTVLVGEPSSDARSLVYKTVDACIAFVFQMDCRHVVTVEGMQHALQLTPVQSAMIDGHGSQCGFCTPGFVMALHGLIEESGDQAGAKQLTDAQLRLGLSGNLCRCTGYQQIVDAGKNIGAARRLSQHYDATPILADFAEFSDTSVESTTAAHNGAPAKISVAIPANLNDLLAARTQRPAARLVAGATDLGVQCNHGRFVPREVIYTGRLNDLSSVGFEEDDLVIGATATWGAIEEAVRDRIPEYYEILTRFGSPQIRHLGTLAGNLANASPIADSIPLHMVCGAVIEVASAAGRREIPIEDFYLGYKQLALEPEEVILSIRTPLPPADAHLRLHKISKRRDMDISTVTAAFWLREAGGVIAEARIALGGVGPTVVRVPGAEAWLNGKPLEAMIEAGRMARQEVEPISDVRGSADYRWQLVENLFAKTYYDLPASQLSSGM